MAHGPVASLDGDLLPIDQGQVTQVSPHRLRQGALRDGRAEERVREGDAHGPVPLLEAGHDAAALPWVGELVQATHPRDLQALHRRLRELARRVDEKRREPRVLRGGRRGEQISLTKRPLLGIDAGNPHVLGGEVEAIACRRDVHSEHQLVRVLRGALRREMGGLRRQRLALGVVGQPHGQRRDERVERSPVLGARQAKGLERLRWHSDARTGSCEQQGERGTQPFGLLGAGAQL